MIDFEKKILYEIENIDPTSIEDLKQLFRTTIKSASDDVSPKVILVMLVWILIFSCFPQVKCFVFYRTSYSIITFLQFNAKKMGNSDISSKFSEMLQGKLNNFQTTIETLLTFYKNSVKEYSKQMQTELDKHEYVTSKRFAELHQNASTKAIEQVWNYKNFV